MSFGLVEEVRIGNGRGGSGAEGDPGTLNKRLVRGPAAELHEPTLRTPVPVGLGLRLLRLQFGLAKPLPVGRNGRSQAGVTTAIWSSSIGDADVSMAAAVSRTEGTFCSSCSVVLERGMRCGLGGWV